MTQSNNPVLKEIQQHLTQKKLILFLDYDGTLTPIVDTPDQAVLSASNRELVASIAALARVAIVSGRATEDVKKKVDIDGIFYAGSHGFEIVQPDGNVHVNEEAQQVRKTLEHILKQLGERLRDIDGVLIEDVKYTVSVHYRLVDEADVPTVEAEVDRILSEVSGFQKMCGKKVFEIRPQIDWHKGKAVRWILDLLRYNPAQDFAVYIGDDTTDEDAFEVLKGNGMGILVAEKARASHADFRIKDTAEVSMALEVVLKHLKNLENQD